MDLKAFATQLRRLTRDSSEPVERVASMINAARSVAVADLLHRLGPALRRVDVIGATVTCSLHTDNSNQLATVSHSTLSADVAAALALDRRALVEVTVDIESDGEPTGNVVLVIELQS